MKARILRQIFVHLMITASSHSALVNKPSTQTALRNQIQVSFHRSPDFLGKRVISLGSEGISQTQVQFGYASLGGVDPDRPQKVNQDQYFVFKDQFQDSELIVAGVLDGHGTKGHLITKYLKDQIPKRFQRFLCQIKLVLLNEAKACFLENCEDKDNLQRYVDSINQFSKYDQRILVEDLIYPSSRINMEDVLKQLLTLTFVMVHLDVCNKEGIPAGRSGTTCVMCVIDTKNNKVYTANVGDSRAILIGKHEIVALSQETTIALQPYEKARIHAAEGRIVGTNVFYGPVGIAMTRALGDAVMLRAGVVPIPQISVHDVDKHNTTIVLATDGIFDVLSNVQIMDFITNQKSICLNKVAEHLTCLAQEQWKADLPIEVNSDDMTCVIIAA